jgi:hypothetical protein
VKFDVGEFMKICVETPNSFEIGQKHGEFYMKASVRCIVAGDKFLIETLLCCTYYSYVSDCDM